MRFIFKTDYEQDIKLLQHGGHWWSYGLLLAVLAAWWLLGQVPSWLQAIGGALVVAGILLVRAGEPGAVGVPELPEVSPGTGRTTPAAPGT